MVDLLTELRKRLSDARDKADGPGYDTEMMAVASALEDVIQLVERDPRYQDLRELVSDAVEEAMQQPYLREGIGGRKAADLEQHWPPCPEDSDMCGPCNVYWRALRMGIENPTLAALRKKTGVPP